MSAALINLVSKGVQDAYIIGDPQVSFYRQNYKRHTNFSMKPVELKPVGTQSAGSEISLPIERKGDLLTYVWCEASSGSETTAPLSNIQTGEQNTPTEFSLRIGGVEIDRQDAFYSNSLWSRFLATSASKNGVPSDTDEIFPLHFFHCDNLTTPLPLVGLQNAPLEIRVKHSPYSNPGAIRYYANYVMLDTDERKFFASQEHELLITQVQRIEADQRGADLFYLNHPVKALLWGQDGAGTFKVNDVQIQINGTDLFGSKMSAKYFNRVIPYHHSEYAGALDDDLYMYTFANQPNRHQPTGSCNFSRVDNSRITWTCTDGNSGDTKGPSYLYAVNYNILRIQSGLGGLAFSN